MDVIENMLHKFLALGCRMCLNFHFFFYLHLDISPQNFSAANEHKGEYFHQGIKKT